MPRKKNISKDPIREATIGALKQIADPMLELMFDAGVTVKEFTSLLRSRAVRAAGGRIVKDSGRSSKSRIAIMTGIPRSEVTKILESIDLTGDPPAPQHPARRVLAAWYESPQFLAFSGEPAVLPIFGKTRSFERLVLSHGGGIPVRAMLDELTEINAVERLAGQKVKARSRVPILTGLSTNAVSAVGEHCRDLLRTLTSNLRSSSSPLFEATAVASDADGDLVPIVRRELAGQAASFIGAANSFLKRSRRNHQIKSETGVTYRLGVTTFYFEEEIPRNAKEAVEIQVKHRKNLRRRLRPRKGGPRSAQENVQTESE